MYIETDEAVYETFFHHAQIEITGCCNMHCEHCRANMEKPIFMSCNEINTILQFANMNRDEEFNLTLSGGEPFLHPEIISIIEMAVGYGYKEIVITTNGSLLSQETIETIDEISKGTVTIQISLDSINPSEHDRFRGFPGAFDKAIRTLEILKEYKNVSSSIRMTIKRETYDQIENMVKLAIDKGCVRIGIGNIIPAGLGADSKFVLSPDEKRKFIEKLAYLNKKYADLIDITTEDPLKAVINESPWVDEATLANETVDGLFGGCTAGIDCFNVDTEYNFTPCSVFRVPIMNMKDYSSLDAMEEAYSSSNVVKKMCSRIFTGKCNDCAHKRICGGCRATASFFGKGDFFYSDGTCWL